LIYLEIVISVVALFQLFTGKEELLGPPGLIYILTLPILILLLLFINAYLIKKEINIKRWIWFSTNIAVFVLVIFLGALLHYIKSTTKLYLVSEGYIYNAQILNEKYQDVYFGRPECLDPNCIQKFEDELPMDPFAMLPTAVFRISERIKHGDYFIQIIFGRNTYKDTLYDSVYFHNQMDTVWVRSRHLSRLK